MIIFVVTGFFQDEYVEDSVLGYFKTEEKANKFAEEIRESTQGDFYLDITVEAVTVL